MNEWLYNNEPITEIDEKYQAFVYLITNLETGRKYIGKKRLKFSKTKQKNGKKKKVKVASDWKSYHGSCKELTEDIAKIGEDNFRREILYLCLSIGTSSYLEAKLQFQHEVLEKPEEYYNRYIHCRVHPNHLKMKENE